MAPEGTLWEAEPHTRAKHAVLRSYLEAWFPILAKYNGRIVYYDGFAGPGRYLGGEAGSPLIALDVALAHSAELSTDLQFVFVEERADRAAHLSAEVARVERPQNFHADVVNGKFEEALRTTLDALDNEGHQLAPTFAFVDPFGINGVPFDLIARLLSRSKCEALITFMNVTLQRFVTELPAQADRLIGLDGASKTIAAAHGSEARTLVSRQLYETSLRRSAKFVRFFEMRDRDNRPVYDLFFATNNALGHYKMKEAMWKVDAGGDFSFSDGVDPNQTVLFRRAPDQELATILNSRFMGRSVDSAEVLRFTRDESAYLDKHARAALTILEAAAPPNARVSVAPNKSDGKKRRPGTFAPGTLVTFLKAGG